MKTTISLENSVLEQLLTYTQSKAAKDSVSKAIDEYIRFKQRLELLSCLGGVEIDDHWGGRWAIWKSRHENGDNRFLCLDRFFQSQNRRFGYQVIVTDAPPIVGISYVTQ